jgi:hypothetical protein
MNAKLNKSTALIVAHNQPIESFGFPTPKVLFFDNEEIESDPYPHHHSD